MTPIILPKFKPRLELVRKNVELANSLESGLGLNLSLSLLSHRLTRMCSEEGVGTLSVAKYKIYGRLNLHLNQ